MVNLDQVKVLRREKENMFIELGYQGVQEIPISKTYGEEVLRRIIPIE
jgi:DNA-binding LytR/AlgR family response regulator